MILRPRIATITLLFAVLAGCDSLPGNKPDAIATELATPRAPLSSPVQSQAATPEDKPISMRKAGDSKTQTAANLTPGTGRLLNYEAAARAAPGGSGAAASGDESTLNFENQPIQAVVQAILGAWLGENYTISPAVTGNVTFSTSKPISSSQALPVLEMLLSWTNNALIRKQGRYEVVPVKDAVAGNLTVGITGVRMVPGYQLRVFPLKYISPSEMQKLLKPYAKADSIVSADNSRSMIVMAGTQFELQNYERTIDVFDVDWLKGMSVGVFGLRNVEVAKIMPELDKIFGDKAETPVAGMFRFIPMEATNSIIVITPQSDYLKRVQEWLYRLDVGAGENGTQLYVYDVKNVKAVDLSDHLNAIYTGKTSGTKSSSGGTAPGLKAVSIGGGIGGGGGGGLSNGSLSGGGLSQNKPTTPNGGTNLTTTGTGAPVGPNGTKETDIRIAAIEENNQLLIMATPGEYDSILAAIHRLDVNPLQVQIEAKVLEVSLQGDLQYGVQWYLMGLINNASGTNAAAAAAAYQTNPNAGTQYAGNPYSRHQAALGGSTPVTNAGGAFYSFLNKNFQVAINALQTNGTTKILSAPSMVVLNNQEAQITVGQQIPIQQTSIVGLGTTTTGVSTSSGTTTTGISQVSYISTGVTLDVKPRVNPGGLVYLEISQEVSSPGTAASGSTNPPINQRNLNTQIAVQSGETVLLGGMILENDLDSTSGVPLLSSVPYLGKLFGSTQKTTSRSEIIVLITPQVITNEEDARLMTAEYQKQFQSLAPLRAKQEKEGKRSPDGTPVYPQNTQPATITPLPKSNP